MAGIGKLVKNDLRGLTETAGGLIRHATVGDIVAVQAQRLQSGVVYRCDNLADVGQVKF